MAEQQSFFVDMLVSILVGLIALTSLSLGSAALLYAHLTGQVRRPVVIGAIAAGIVLGAGLLAGSIADGDTFRRLTFPIGVFLVLAGAVAGLIMLRLESASSRAG